MKKILFFVLLIHYSQICFARPFENGNAQTGKLLVEKNCVSCHASSFGGDGSGIYLRDDRIVKTSSGLLTQVRNCNTMIGLKWFEDDELNVARYLNDNYYKFEK